MRTPKGGYYWDETIQIKVVQGYERSEFRSPGLAKAGYSISCKFSKYYAVCILNKI